MEPAGGGSPSSTSSIPTHHAEDVLSADVEGQVLPETSEDSRDDEERLSPTPSDDLPPTTIEPPPADTSDPDGLPRALVPPHWQNAHVRRPSYASSIDAGKSNAAPILLVDHTLEEAPEYDGNAVWAKAIYIEDYVVVGPASSWRSNAPSSIVAGSFVVWHCKIDTMDGGSFTIRRRYSEFYDLRRKLLMTFPSGSAAMPAFPPKSIIYRFQPTFLEKRRVALGYWLTCVLLNPEFSSSPVTKEFIFGR